MNATPFHRTRHLLALLSLVVLGVVPAKHASAACQLESVELPVTMRGAQAVLRAGINGIDASFVVDSGAVFSMIAPAAAADLQLPSRSAPPSLQMYGIGGTTEIRVTRVKRFTLGKTDFDAVEFLVGGNLAVAGGAVGLLGQNFLGGTDVEYDFANGVVRLHYPSKECKKARLAYWAKEQPVVEVALESTTQPYVPRITTTAYVNGVKLRVMLDSGASVSTLSRSAARRAGITRESKGVQPGYSVQGVGAREVAAWVAPVDSFALGGEKIRDTQLLVTDAEIGSSDDVDMLLGADFFLSHRVYVARSQETIYFTYNGGPVFSILAGGADNLRNDPASAGDAATTGGDSSGPTTADGFARRAAASAARRDFNRALADLNHACEMAPRDAGYLLQRARVRLALAQGAPALTDLNEAIRLDPANLDAVMVRASLHVAMGDADGARDDLATADSLAKSQSYVRRDIADIYLALDLPEAALGQFDRWISAHGGEPDVPMALNGRCWARALLGTELDKALADCDAAIRAEEKSEYLDSRGLVYLRLNRLTESIKDYDAALRLSPKAAWSLYGRGLARIRNGAVEAGNADIAAAKAVDKTIEDAALHYGLKP